MKEDRVHKKIFIQELEGTRRRGRPRKRWKEEVERDLQVVGVRRWRELVADRKKMEGHCSTGQSPQWAVVPMEEEEVVTEYRLRLHYKGQSVTALQGNKHVTTLYDHITEFVNLKSRR
jgi:hypothetical protein